MRVRVYPSGLLALQANTMNPEVFEAETQPAALLKQFVAIVFKTYNKTLVPHACFHSMSPMYIYKQKLYLLFGLRLLRPLMQRSATV